jgi:hypothetical protein
LTLVHRLLAARLELQPDRIGRLVRFISIAIVQFAAMALARTAAEALFLANLGATALPTYLLLVGVIVVPAAGVMSRLIDRMPKAKLYRISLALALGVAVVLRALAATGTRPAWYAVLVGVILIEVLLAIQFFVLITDYFTTLEQKRLIGTVTLVAAAGSALGGGLANLLVLAFSTADLLLIYPALFFVLYPLVVRRERRREGRPSEASILIARVTVKIEQVTRPAMHETSFAEPQHRVAAGAVRENRDKVVG